MKKLLTLCVALSASFPTLANTTQVSSVQPITKCSEISGKLIPHQEPFQAGELKGTAVGYKLPNGFVINRNLVPNEEQRLDITISKSPRFHQSGQGCLIKFAISSPAGYTFYELDDNHKFNPFYKFMDVQMAKSEP